MPGTINTATHEINHAVQDVLLPSYNDYRSEYKDAKHEHHAALMVLRRILGLHPEKRDYTDEDARHIYEVGKKSKNQDIIRMFDSLKKKSSNDADFNSKLKDMLNN